MLSPRGGRKALTCGDKQLLPIPIAARQECGVEAHTIFSLILKHRLKGNFSLPGKGLSDGVHG
jgi:hypothetical protein